ncbi:MAG: PepSY-associated TM helix domain-containing protein [Verrucomicrobia bacterium]|nr:PepSY-associated TM helix domain-containing protein [Verrucomicrobiota bacterium]
MNIRRLLLWLHRWAGVLSGLVILVIAVTGGALVFEQTIQRWIRPDLYPQQATAKADRITISSVLANDPRVQGIRLPRDERDALVLFAGPQAFHIDPRNGKLLGTRPRMGGWEQTMMKLHVNLLQGPTGGTVVVVATCITLGLALTGLWLWWPLRIFGFRKGANFRRFNLDLHSVAGLYSSVFLLILGFTGLTLRYMHGEHPQPPQVPFVQQDQPHLSVDEAIKIAEAALPGARAASVEMPPPQRPVFRIQLAFPEDGSPAGRSVTFISRIDGRVLDTHSSREGTLLEKYQMAQLSIHIGSIGGTTTRWLAFLTCAALLLQIVSGYVLWWKRKSS